MDSKERSLGKILQDIFNSILIALCIAVILKVFFIESFFIPSSSMENSFKPGDQILVWKFLYNKKIPIIKKRFSFGISIKRKDLIIFSVNDKEGDYIKRVVGLPGDNVLLKNNQVFINNIVLYEPYLKEKDNIKYLNTVFEVPWNKVFVLGDNRNNSSDSRDFGFVDINKIIGKVFSIFYPFNRMRFF